MGGSDVARVLIVDDSATARLALRLALERDGGIEVVGEVERGDAVLAAVRRLRPDLVVLDLFLAKASGLDVAETLMREQALPILLITAADPTCPDLTYRAMAAGVLEVCAKLPAATSLAYPRRRLELVRLVRALARVPVVHRRHSTRPSASPSAPPISGSLWPRERESLVVPSEPPLSRAADGEAGSRPLLLIGASTGGPKLVRDLLCAVSPRLGMPVVVAQHIALGFAPGLADWLSRESRRRVTLVEAPISPERGAVYLPPLGRHLEVRGGVLVPVDLNAVHTPSIDWLFTTAARDLDRGSVAVLLTGMGCDGAAGLLALHRAGATTIAQRPSTCVVDSMPRAAIAAGAVRLVLTPGEIAETLVARCSG